MFAVILDSDDFGRERFKYDTLAELLSAVERLYHECAGRALGVPPDKFGTLNLADFETNLGLMEVTK